MQYACAVLYCHLCPVWPQFSGGEGERGGGGASDINKILPEIFLIIRIIRHDIVINFIIIPCNIKYYFEYPAYCTMFYY